MNKLFIRLVAVSLIPTLLTNPALAAGFAGKTPSPLLVATTIAQQSLFERQAITAVLAWVGVTRINPTFTAKVRNGELAAGVKANNDKQEGPRKHPKNSPDPRVSEKIRRTKRIWNGLNLDHRHWMVSLKNFFVSLIPPFPLVSIIGLGGGLLVGRNIPEDLKINPEVIHSFGGLLTKRVRATIVRVTDTLGEEQQELMWARDAYEAQVVANPDEANFLHPDALIRDNDGNNWTSEEIRTRKWKVSQEIPIPAELTEKPGLQLTGPAAKMDMLINGLNSNAVHYMIDFEDAQTDKGLSFYQAMQNVYEIISGRIKLFKKGEKTYTPKDPSQWTKIIFRHRGPHLLNRQMTYKGKPVPATISDIVMASLNYYEPLRKLGKGLYFYSPKIQTWQEALWVDAIFREVEKELGIPTNTIKIFALHERIEHSLQQEEIMWVLRGRFIGPNVGRWDYLNSDIYLTHGDPKHVYPDPHTILMTVPHMDYYSNRNVAVAVKHGAIPIGGMAAQMKNPLRKDLDAVAIAAIGNDKTREHKQGYKWSWTATIDKEYVDAGNEALRQPRDPQQPVDYIPVDYTREARDKLLAVPPGKRTSLGVMVAIHYAIRYMLSQQMGDNAAAIEDPISGIRFMNDFATYEIFWHWLWTMVHHEIRMEDMPRDYADRKFEMPFFQKLFQPGWAPYAGKKMDIHLFNLMLTDYELEIINSEFKKDFDAYHDSLWPSVFEIMRRQIAAPKLVNYGAPTLLALVDESNPIARHDLIEKLFKQEQPSNRPISADRHVTINIPAALMSTHSLSQVHVSAPSLLVALKTVTDSFPDLEKQLFDSKGNLQPMVCLSINGEDRTHALDTQLQNGDRIDIKYLPAFEPDSPISARSLAPIKTLTDKLGAFYHELGHAVAGTFMGLRTRIVGINSEPRTEIIGSIGRLGRVRMIIFYLAGIIPIVPLLLSLLSGIAVPHITVEAYQQGGVVAGAMALTASSAIWVLAIVVPTVRNSWQNYLGREHPGSDYSRLVALLNKKFELALPFRLSARSVTKQEADIPLTVEQKKEAADLENDWATNPRWKGVVREYSGEEVVRIMGLNRIQYTLADQGSENLWRATEPDEFPYIHTFGVTDMQGGAAQSVSGLLASYKGGWNDAAQENEADEIYPDQSIQPSNTTPRNVKKINNGFKSIDVMNPAEFTERAKKPAWWKGSPWVLPIVADIDTGFGGNLNVFAMVQQLVEAGAAGWHVEDQDATVKKCGHMVGKVLIPTKQFIQRLKAGRLAADAMRVPMVLVARTDAEAASLITSDADERDRKFLRTHDIKAGDQVLNGNKVESGGHLVFEKDGYLETQEDGRLETPEHYYLTPSGHFRTVEEGYFVIRGGLEGAIARGLSYAPYADMIWFETKKADLEQARKFAEAIHAQFPGKKLAYNMSGNFPWHNYDREFVEKFSIELAKLGYVFRFNTTAGWWMRRIPLQKYAMEFNDKNGMGAAYDFLTEVVRWAEERGFAWEPQKMSRAGYFDTINKTINRKSATLALKSPTGEKSTEADFEKHAIRMNLEGSKNGRLETLRDLASRVQGAYPYDLKVNLHDPTEVQKALRGLSFPLLANAVMGSEAKPNYTAYKERMLSLAQHLPDNAENAGFKAWIVGRLLSAAVHMQDTPAYDALNQEMGLVLKKADPKDRWTVWAESYRTLYYAATSQKPSYEAIKMTTLQNAALLTDDNAVWAYVPMMVAAAMANDREAYEAFKLKVPPLIELNRDARPAWAWSWLSYAAAIMNDADGYNIYSKKTHERIGALGGGHFNEETMARGISLLAEARWEERPASITLNTPPAAALLPAVSLLLTFTHAPLWLVITGFFAGLLSPMFIFKGPQSVIAKLFRRTDAEERSKDNSLVQVLKAA